MTTQLFNTLVWIWIALGLMIVPLQFIIAAPYGRHTKTNWGPMIDNRAGWFLMEVPALIVFVYFIMSGSGFTFDLRGMLCFFYSGHYVYRSLLFPLLLRTKSKRMPLAIALSAIFFNAVNASVNGYWLGSLSLEAGHPYIMDFTMMAGLILFAAGFATHVWHDRILISLRKNSDGGYSIPRGGLFRWISCPNFMGEIVEWSGFALMCWSLPAFSFLCWTCGNLVPRAWQHHRWYRMHFADYPESRKALIPGVF